MTPSIAFEPSCPGDEVEAEAVAWGARFVAEALALEEAEEEVDVDVEEEEGEEDAEELFEEVRQLG